MADITSLVSIYGANQSTDRAFGWHVWRVVIHSGTLTAGQVDDILLPDRFEPGTVILDVRVATTKVIAAVTSCLYDLERKRVHRVTGAVDQSTNLIAANDLETLDTVGGTDLSNAAYQHWSNLEADNGIMPVAPAASLYQGAFNIELSPIGTISAGSSEIHVAALVGRVSY
jgi:hypothetical protein